MKKIIILNALKFSSIDSPSLDLHNNGHSQTKEVCIASYLNTLDHIEDIVLKDDDALVFIYIAGYKVKIVKRTFTWELCIYRYELDKDLDVNVNIQQIIWLF